MQFCWQLLAAHAEVIDVHGQLQPGAPIGRYRRDIEKGAEWRRLLSCVVDRVLEEPGVYPWNKASR